MVNKVKFIEQLRNNPKNIKFSDMCSYLNSFASDGLKYRQQGTSHRIYKKSGFKGIINIQPDKGSPKMCKWRQVIQVIAFLEDSGLLKEEKKQ